MANWKKGGFGGKLWGMNKIIFIVITFCCYLIASDSNSGISVSIDTFGKYNFQNDDDYDVSNAQSIAFYHYFSNDFGLGLNVQGERLWEDFEDSIWKWQFISTYVSYRKEINNELWAFMNIGYGGYSANLEYVPDIGSSKGGLMYDFGLSRKINNLFDAQIKYSLYNGNLVIDDVNEKFLYSNFSFGLALKSNKILSNEDLILNNNNFSILFGIYSFGDISFNRDLEDFTLFSHPQLYTDALKYTNFYSVGIEWKKYGFEYQFKKIDVLFESNDMSSMNFYLYNYWGNGFFVRLGMNVSNISNFSGTNADESITIFPQKKDGSWWNYLNYYAIGFENNGFEEIKIQYVFHLSRGYFSEFGWDNSGWNMEEYYYRTFSMKFSINFKLL